MLTRNILTHAFAFLCTHRFVDNPCERRTHDGAYLSDMLNEAKRLRVPVAVELNPGDPTTRFTYYAWVFEDLSCLLVAQMQWYVLFTVPGPNEIVHLTPTE